MYLTQSLHRMLQQRADKPLTIFGDRQRTVAQSAERIARLAGALRSLGVARDDRVAFLGWNSDHYHEYCYAVPWAGGVLNPVNVRWSATEIAYSLQDSETKVMIVDDAFAPVVPDLRAAGAPLSIVIYSGDRSCPPSMLDYEELVSNSAPVADSRRDGDALFGIFYTGGTTGRPKGVMLSHNNVITSALGLLASGQFLSQDARMLHAMPLFHMGAIGMWVTANVAGATHVLVPSFTVREVAQAISAYRVTDVLLVSTMVQMLLDDPSAAGYDLSSLRRLTFGAAPTPDAVFERTSKALPTAALSQAYGMTELAPAATFLLPTDHEDPALRRSAGRALPHVELRVVDDRGLEVRRGEIGELVAHGDNVMLGYWNRPEETASAICDGWLKTGDLARMDERGYVFIVDRLKDMVISGGENVYPAEVENALASHPAVGLAAVIGVPDERWGERVHALIVLRAGSHATEESLRQHCRRLIAGYKVPRSVDFVDDLPVSGTGKVLKRDIRARYRAPLIG
ncbi:fatty-acid--CoA ligase [Mycobacterium paraense]|uniref:Fatty-acid--CoA ligase n=1 Tax=Mycobacterium paraense TaxID=767916 RepID=A0ABX3VR54_9MYCO|nr:long-chain-fatty-acid--CoA ligase [Mycobacterium paraense]ORW32761.1 fatty-acid--CoA ligase [Mycobacterium paraense]ORW44987.1 fatty-acid--CoA ligase [Mycobacterium paraense]